MPTCRPLPRQKREPPPESERGSIRAGPAGSYNPVGMGISPEPEVTLVNAFHRPYDTVVATARTCYSPKVVLPEDVSGTDKARETRDRIFRSIFEAGHHTTMQHPHFQFVLRRVSRHFLWSFLHSHPFYNSEQVSQRYVEVKPENFLTPSLEGANLELYRATIRRQMEAYRRLQEILLPEVEAEYFRLFPARRKDAGRWEGNVHKRALELARYVLPVATHAHLYHTISGITLYRYRRLCEQYDAPEETRRVVEKMVEEVAKVDPDFFRNVDEPLPLEETVEHRVFEEFFRTRSPAAGDGFVRQFDARLEGMRSRLIGRSMDPEGTIAEALRVTLGLGPEQLPDAEAVERVLNPAKNTYLTGRLNVNTLSKVTRALHHVHFTFAKKLSHTADSQDQRHRMTPGSRPLLRAHFTGQPDAIEPDLIARNAEASELFHGVLRHVWEAVGTLLSRGVRWEDAQYLLPNALSIRFLESGDLLNLHHKWTTRLCYLAQEEIWRCCKEEVEQVSRLAPSIGRWLHAPCGLRKWGGKSPYCPEGNRFCGVRVWELAVSDWQRVL